MHVRINEDSNSFITRYGFNSETVNIEPWVNFLKPENHLISSDNDLLFLRGHNVNGNWLCAFDSSSKRLWIVVFYPDPSDGLP